MVLPTRKTGALKAHIGAVHCVSYSAGTSTYVLSGGADRKIHLWNPTSTALIQTYSAHGYAVLSLSISHDNLTFASAGGDKLLFLWDVTAATTIRRFEGHNARINAVSFNAESTVLASGSYDATVKLWDCKSSNRKPIQTLDEAKDSVMDVEIRGTDIITACVDGRIRNYDMRMGRCVVDYVSTKGVTSVQGTEDGAAVLVSALDGKVRLMDKRDGRMLQSFTGHVNKELRVRSCFAEREEFVVSGSEDGTVWCWDLVSGEMKAKLVGHGEGKGGKAVSCVDTRRSGGQMVTGGADGTVVVWGV
ncbi:WD40 repeat-like protein [Ascodesmis nigricans]|uniref:WD40 repeat-like protein n=1 Tax=Ascodesmis nigricans TaxID=341454 RepID=A0A4S2MWX7_9PEZI|nr:WD40 repeat-like protein [Ascodesmis nigricans]